MQSMAWEMCTARSSSSVVMSCRLSWAVDGSVVVASIASSCRGPGSTGHRRAEINPPAVRGTWGRSVLEAANDGGEVGGQAGQFRSRLLGGSCALGGGRGCVRDSGDGGGDVTAVGRGVGDRAAHLRRRGGLFLHRGGDRGGVVADLPDDLGDLLDRCRRGGTREPCSQLSAGRTASAGTGGACIRYSADPRTGASTPLRLLIERFSTGSRSEMIAFGDSTNAAPQCGPLRDSKSWLTA